MTRLFNDPADFAVEMVEGFAAANRDRVLPVSGGVVRSAASRPGSVAVVIGGGSGHYPAFGGLVGPGLAAGAAMGNLFASPSARQVHTVATAAHAGGGVLLSYGNYAGDVLNFDTAQARLREDGIDCRTVVVTDDVSSAPKAERNKRRGVAGDLSVFKIAGAAAAEGADLDEVERLARRANDRTRSFGVAFSGCTLPGATEPLFTVPEGRMAIGLGIHGEPGLGETDIPTADGLAQLFVETLLDELPDDIALPRGARVAVVLNGLGSVKYEELFVVYRRVNRLLEDAGAEIVEPDVGELCTSFDMAGASLTLCWLDDELERLWRAPADSPAYRKGSIGPVAQRDAASIAAITATDAVPAASVASRSAARLALQAIETVSATVDIHADELGRIDAVAGDGDHGIGMQRGAHAALEAARAAAEAGAGVRTLFEWAGDAWADHAGGTSGALWGLALRTIGRSMSNQDAPDAAAVSTGVGAAADAIQAFGKAKVGDKTMIDAIVPFRETLAARIGEGDSLGDAWVAAASTATTAAAATANLLPHLGRARPHAEKSLGTPDAGAHSFALIAAAVGTVLKENR